MLSRDNWFHTCNVKVPIQILEKLDRTRAADLVLFVVLTSIKSWHDFFSRCLYCKHIVWSTGGFPPSILYIPVLEAASLCWVSLTTKTAFCVLIICTARHWGIASFLFLCVGGKGGNVSPVILTSQLNLLCILLFCHCSDLFNCVLMKE